MLWHFSGTYLDTGSVSLSSCRDAEQCWLKPGISPGSWSILQCSDYSIFFSIIFNWKTTWAVEISCEMKILSDFTPIASEHPIEDICFSMPTIVPRSQCFNSKILMGLVRRSSKQKFRRSFREKIKPFLFSKMVVFCNFPLKKKSKKKKFGHNFPSLNKYILLENFHDHKSISSYAYKEKICKCLHVCRSRATDISLQFQVVLSFVWI